MIADTPLNRDSHYPVVMVTAGVPCGLVPIFMAVEPCVGLSAAPYITYMQFFGSYGHTWAVGKIDDQLGPQSQATMTGFAEMFSTLAPVGDS